MKSATLVLNSANAKLGRVAATYASIASTCPLTCPLKGEGCYAQTGNVSFTVRRLDSSGASSLETALEEARLIEEAPKSSILRLPLRLHVSGDARTAVAARVLAKAATTWRNRGGGVVWTYTHAWRNVPRTAWGPQVNVLASVERTSDAPAAISQGYVPAVVVDRHSADGRAYVKDGVRWIPCLEQTRGQTCAECRLCWDVASLRARGAGIAFAVHGSQSKRALKVIQ